MIEAVLFDYGMVLSGPPAPAAWTRMLDVTALEEERFAAAYWAPRHAYDRGNHTGPEYWVAAGRHAGIELSGAQIAELMAADVHLWTELNQPMVDWAARLQAAGTRTGILSNLGDAMEAGVVAKMTWLTGFDATVYSHRLKMAKPELEIYLHSAKVLQTPVERILFIDDRADNCAGADAAGLQAIQYGDHAEFVREMERRGWGELWRTGRSGCEG